MREVLSLVCLHVPSACTRLFANYDTSFRSTYDHSLNLHGELLDPDPSRPARFSHLDRPGRRSDW